MTNRNWRLSNTLNSQRQWHAVNHWRPFDEHKTFPIFNFSSWLKGNPKRRTNLWRTSHAQTIKALVSVYSECFGGLPIIDEWNIAKCGELLGEMQKLPCGFDLDLPKACLSINNFWVVVKYNLSLSKSIYSHSTYPLLLEFLRVYSMMPSKIWTREYIITWFWPLFAIVFHFHYFR